MAASAANPAILSYALHKSVDELTYVSSNQGGVFIQKLYTKGQHNFSCVGNNSPASTSSSNRSLEGHGEFDIKHF